VSEGPDEWIRFRPTGSIERFIVDVPGDLSSAAFLVGAALLASGGGLAITGVGLNPTRSGFLTVLERMGARITVEPTGEQCGEPVGTLLVKPASLVGTTVSAGEIPALIDEIPLLAILASRATGPTTFHEVGELRFKESDRLTLLAENLRAIGADAVAEGNTLQVQGRRTPPSGLVRTAGDHRLAMAFQVLGVVSGAQVRVDDPDCAEVSFPGFARTLQQVTGR
jgi:3-phosphoshikimate 1-carboxyvinyltransferase